VATPTAIYFAPDDQPVPEVLGSWLNAQGLTSLTIRDEAQLMALLLRGRPRVIAMDARTAPAPCLAACKRMKSDSYTGIVPCFVLAADSDEAFAAAFAAGADEVVRANVATAELMTRLSVMLRRSDRDLLVHPSTRLPGAVEIDREVQRRLSSGVLFAMCYADLDHFKEFNDRYSYYDGDRVIRILAQILHDVVKGLCAEQGFVGHIGGDDFIFIIPVDWVNDVCSEIIDVFDTLIPFQYSEQDRRAGYFFGKDRRGQLHRVPLMTLSIGVVTNERRHFTHAAQVSELATEMKSYAKTLAGSVYSIDRRQNPGAVDAPPGAPGIALPRPRSVVPEGK
jgi:diguanylate cyclase (GGDEF)-like protein